TRPVPVEHTLYAWPKSATSGYCGYVPFSRTLMYRWDNSPKIQFSVFSVSVRLIVMLVMFARCPVPQVVSTPPCALMSLIVIPNASPYGGCSCDQTIGYGGSTV